MTLAIRYTQPGERNGYAGRSGVVSNAFGISCRGNSASAGPRRVRPPAPHSASAAKRLLFRQFDLPVEFIEYSVRSLCDAGEIGIAMMRRIRRANKKLIE